MVSPCDSIRKYEEGIQLIWSKLFLTYILKGLVVRLVLIPIQVFFLTPPFYLSSKFKPFSINYYQSFEIHFSLES